MSVVLASLEHRGSGEAGDVACAADVVRMHVRHDDSLDRCVELVEHRAPARFGVARAEAGVHEDPTAGRGAQEVTVNVVDAERQVEGDAVDAALELLDHAGTVDDMPGAVRSRTAPGVREL